MKHWRTCLLVGGAGFLSIVCLPTVAVFAADVDSDPDDRYIEIPLGDHPASGGRTKAPVPAPPPPSKPDPRVDALVQQLGDPDFRQREAAVAKLKEIGPSALPALKRAAEESTDAEVVSRASGVVRFLEGPRGSNGSLSSRFFTDPRLGGRGRGGGFPDLRMSVDNGAHRVEVREHNGRVIQIESGPNGIEMSVTGEEDGERITRRYQARTPEDLRAQNPEAYALYERWTGHAPGILRRRGGVRGAIPFHRPFPQPMPVLPLPGEQGMLEMQDLLLRPNGAEAAMVERQRREILGLLEEVRRRRAADAVDDPFAKELAERIRADRERILREAEEIHERLRAQEDQARENAKK